jgi:hypothetical protein
MASAHNQPVPSPLPSSASDAATNQPDGIIFPSAARTVAGSPYTSDEMYNPVCKGVRLYIKITSSGAETVTVKIQTRDPNSDTWVDLTAAVSAALTSNQTRTLTVYPGIATAAGTATTNTEASEHLGLSWRVVATVGGATATFSVGGEYIL